MRAFYHLLGNTTLAGIANFVVMFALTYFSYLETGSVIATSILGGTQLVFMALSSIWFGGIVDHHRKKNAMLFSGAVSLAVYVLAFAMYLLAPEGSWDTVASPYLWAFIALNLVGVVFGNIRNIALPVTVGILVPEDRRDRANGLVGMSMGLSFLIVSGISGFLVGFGGMYYVYLLAIPLMALTLAHLFFVSVPEAEIVHTAEKPKKLDVKGTIAAIGLIPGLFALIFFTTFNNFLGGAFMSLMDAYGLSLVSVQTWGLVWMGISTAFMVGGTLIAKFGLGKNPLKALFRTNVIIWFVCIFFTVQPSIVLLAVGSFIYMCVVPFIEASEHTIIQKVVPLDRQGRVFGFAQSVEMGASPVTAFLIGPITQFFFIPLMSEGGRGAQLIGSWYGVGPGRGIGLVFTIVGVIGLCITLIAWASPQYKRLSKQYLAA
jgi:DHA3 family multidrug efflux protein-like MFS transporter